MLYKDILKIGLNFKNKKTLSFNQEFFEKLTIVA